MNIKFATKSSQKSETHLEPEVENISFKIVVGEVFDSKVLNIRSQHPVQACTSLQ